MFRYLIAVIALVAVGLAATILFWPEDQVLEKKHMEAEEIKAQIDQANKKVRTGTVFQDVMAGGAMGPFMVEIPAGEFTMGAPQGEKSRWPDETQTAVTIAKPFAIGQFEVTFDEYDLFAQETGRAMAKDGGWGRGALPVINITWFDALAYADWMAEKTGQPYRLPTEAEWEYMARAGSETPFWWGTFDDPDKAVCTGCDNWPKRQSSPVGKFPANAYGVHEVLGNVWEWTCSNYTKRYDGSQLRCAERDGDIPKVIRGGSWVNKKTMLRAAVRDKFVAGDRNEIVGFRLARDL